MGRWQAPDLFVVEPIKASGGWGDWTPPQHQEPIWAKDEEKKKLFGIELAKGHSNPFSAACEVFPNTADALWVSINWINDVVVLAERDLHRKRLDSDVTPLDKNQLGARILRRVDERAPNGYALIDAETELKYLELYAKINGYLKPDNVNSNNFIANEMKVVVVSSEQKREKPVTETFDEFEGEVIEPLPLKIASVK